MKLAACILLLGACLLHQASAQLNWWETDPNGNLQVASTRRPTAAPTPTAPTGGSTATPPVSPSCACPRTPEYNPVCGNNRVTYDNPGMLDCAKNTCGERVELLFIGRCQKLA